MDPVNTIEGPVSVLDRADVDTDQIIPKQFLKRVERTGFGEFLFYDWLRDGEIELEPNPILVTGKNFGCGSSREHAAVGARGLRLQGAHRAVVRRHLLLELARRSAFCLSCSTEVECQRGRRGGLGDGRPRGADRHLRSRHVLVRDRQRDQAPPPERARRHRRHAQNEAAIDAFESAGKADWAP